MPAEIKQVIVIRRELKMRQGKAVSQGGHACSEFLREQILAFLDGGTIDLSEVEIAWLRSGTAKITLRTDSEEDFYRIQAEAISRGLKIRTITDRGDTEFHGIPTVTALAIGPDYATEIDKVTGDLTPL